jgi:hypothetical protein
MTTFTSFSNILPDPANPITDAGDGNVTGTAGPGFKSISLQSITDTQVSRTVSGRGVTRDQGAHHYEFTISYNPMFRFQFDPINTFLELRNPRKDPFYVILPQYSKPKDTTFNGLTTTKVVTSVTAGKNVLMVYNTAGAYVGKLRPGDMFNINDPDDFNHQKMYKVGAVETNAYYQAATTQPSTSQLRLHIIPPLQRDVGPNATLVLVNPKFRVIAKNDVQEHSLDTDNLYSFSLAVEELQA